MARTYQQLDVDVRDGLGRNESAVGEEELGRRQSDC